MPAEGAVSVLYRFGEYELDSARRLFFRNGERMALTPKALDVLLALIQRRGETVSKDELLREVWPDTVVEEISLTRNISVLRKIFGEKPGEHTYIVTVPGTGYRFVASVEIAEVPAPSSAQAKMARGRRQPPTVWLGAVAAVVIAVAAILSFQLARPAPSTPVWRSIPLTSYPGSELNPALSPEGGRVAFTWDGENQDNFDIYVKTVGSSAPLRLTRNSAADVAPAWSPDGRMIAFLRLDPAGRQQVIVMPSFGTSERKVSETLCDFRVFQQPSLGWAPDGRWLVVSHRESEETREALFLVSIDTGEKRRLTTPPAGYLGDYRPGFSADGRRLAFVRLTGYTGGALYVMEVSRDLRPAGEPLPLTSGDRWLTSPVWSRDGRIAYVLGERVRARHELRLISLSGLRITTPIQLEPDLTELTLGNHLIYVRELQDSNIWRTEIRSPGQPLATPRRFIASTRFDYQPRYSPDGKQIAFLSTRSGTQEIWLMSADGGDASQLTTFGGPHIGGLAWSPDGARLFCHVRVDGRGSLFTVPVSGGEPRRLTRDADDATPSSSRDGRWIYFSRISGRWEIWRMPAEGGAATPLIRSNGGKMPLESSDGKSLYYCHDDPERGIWKAPIQGGQGEPVTGPVAGPVCGLSLSRKGIYYASSDNRSVEVLDFSTGRSRPVATSDRPIGAGFGLSVSPDERFLLFYRLDQSGSDLYMIENFVVPKL